MIYCLNQNPPFISLSPFFLCVVCAGQDQFQDRYFDTPQFDLTLRDVWLRQRKGRWELKCPAATLRGAPETRGERAEAARLCTRYKEMTNVDDIHRKLREVLKDVASECCHQKLTDPRGLGNAEMKSVLEECWATGMNLVCFAEFTTVRRTFTWEEEDGVHVDLDEADFGYRVGEIEVLIPEGGDVQAALDKIERTAKKLGELRADHSLDNSDTSEFSGRTILLPFSHSSCPSTLPSQSQNSKPPLSGQSSVVSSFSL